MWTFEAPGFLFLLLLVPVFMFLVHGWKGRGGRILFPFRNWKTPLVIPGLGGMRFFSILSALLLWGGVCVLIIASAGPGFSRQKKVYLNRGLDIIIILDQSPSMSARDFEPKNRFETAKTVIKDFIADRENDAIGLVGFGSEAALRTPPTLDYDYLVQRLDSQRIMELGEGTAIGMGIAVASLHLRSSSADQKICILLTDGENNAGEILPDTAAEIATKLGVRIYTIGIGTTGEVELEFEDPETGKMYRGIYEGGFDENLLKRIAETSGGAYFSVRNPRMLSSVFDSIDTIETSEKRTIIRIETKPYHRLLILIGAASVFLAFLIRKQLLKEVL